MIHWWWVLVTIWVCLILWVIAEARLDAWWQDFAIACEKAANADACDPDTCDKVQAALAEARRERMQRAFLLSRVEEARQELLHPRGDNAPCEILERVLYSREWASNNTGDLLMPVETGPRMMSADGWQPTPRPPAPKPHVVHRSWERPQRRKSRTDPAGE